PVIPAPNMPPGFVAGKTSLTSEGRITDAIPAQFGKLLSIKQDQAPFIRFVDVETGEWCSPVELDADADCSIAASGNLFYVLRKNRILERWNLATGKKEQAALLDLKQVVYEHFNQVTGEKVETAFIDL